MHSTHRHPISGRLDRRTFLGAAAAAGVLAACSGSDDAAPDTAVPNDPGSDVEPSDGSSSEAPAVAPEFEGDSEDLGDATFDLVQRFPVNQPTLVPGEVRLPHSLAKNAALINDGPTELGAQVIDGDGNAIGDRIMAVRRDVTPSAYYVWRPTIDTPGNYTLVVDGGPATGASFRVDEPDAIAIPSPGQILAGFDTPTADAPGGVDPICTREPNCPFHSLTLAEALNVDRGVAYMIGTPAFCQTGTCAPALEALIEVDAEFSDDFVFVHAEVFTDLTAKEIAPAVTASGLNFEPALFITNRAGEIVERIDTIWNASELRERLTAARG